MAESTEHAESEVIKQFIPTLVVAVGDCVQNVSDRCLAKGLISESTSKRVLDPRGGTSEERARTLIHSVHTNTKTDRSCFQIFLEVLDEELPYRAKEKVLSDMKKELADRAAVMCKAVIPVSQASRPVPLDQGLECIQQQSSFLGRYEDAVSKHASAATQKSLIEETLKSISEESGRLRASLDMLMSQSHDQDEKQITATRNRLSAYETEMAELRERVEELESIIEEEGMRARRGRSTIRVGTKRLLEEFSKQSQEQFSMALKDKEQEHKRILTEKEAEIRQKVQEEMDLKMKDLEHKVALQEKELKIKELELKYSEAKRVESDILPPVTVRMNEAVQDTHLPPTVVKPVRSGTVRMDEAVQDTCTQLPATMVKPVPSGTVRMDEAVQDTCTQLPPTMVKPVPSGTESDVLISNRDELDPEFGIGKVSPLDCTPMPTLKLALRELKPFATKWENIGIELDIDDAVLTSIKLDNHGDSLSCLRDMLRARFNQGDSLCWSDIAEAVQNSGHEGLAQEIRDKYIILY